ncbi:short-chain alcohol dehydrogenase, partial [Pseudomonas sp. M47T1]|uniref:SDR family NAD(P)-dependent oxidoreductase n=1 Tax=Pseudomonas sp. M47T1 TaxID=1179778 RepID=UPI0002606BA0
MNLFNLEGQVALITGATRGIGLAIARAYGQAGARLAISSENAEDCRRVAAQLAEEGIHAWPQAADLGQQGQVQSLAEAVLGQFGQLDILVCNAGIAPHLGPLASATDAQWQATLTVNLQSALWLTSALIPALVARGGGSVVLMAS